MNQLQKWELMKTKVKDFSIDFSRNFQHSLKKKINMIETELSNIENAHYQNIDMNRKRQLEAELSDMYDSKCKGAFIRSRSHWVKEGERNTKYFFGLEKSHQSNNVIKKLVTNENIHVNTNNDILGEMCNFYENLYTSKNINDNDIDNYLQSIDIEKTLNDEEKLFCDKFPSLEECTDAVMNLKPNKSPGLDGLTNEFYKTFWNDLKMLFYDMLKQIFDKKEMSFSQRLAVMSLIFKKGDPLLLKNYRPISLTNTDYKIIAFVFARRLQNILDGIINKNQSAYVKGRFIGMNARLILDIFDYCEETNEDGLIDIHAKFKAMKASWLPKILNDKGYVRNFLEKTLNLQNINFQYILKTNETNTSRYDFIRYLPLFYKEIFIYFNECKKLTPLDNLE